MDMDIEWWSVGCGQCRSASQRQKHVKKQTNSITRKKKKKKKGGRILKKDRATEQKPLKHSISHS